MIGVAVNGLGERRVDFDFESAVRIQRRFTVEHDFGRRLRVAVPPRIRTFATPFAEAGIPEIIAGEPPISRFVKPVPARGWIPVRRMVIAQHFVLHFALRDRRAEIIFRGDRRGDFFAKRQRFTGRVDFHFEFRLLVFFQAELNVAALSGNIDRVIAEHRGFIERELAVDAAKFIGLQIRFVNLLAF